MRIEFPSREFDDAVAAVCHDLASEEQARALNDLMRGNAGARDEYILRLELHSRLASEPDLFTGGEADFSSLNGGERLRNVLPGVEAERGKNVWKTWTIALAACVALMAAGLGSMRILRSVGQRQGISRGVAMLNRTADAQWGPGREIPRLGGPLEPGQLRLESGLAEIIFYSGARVVIEGPAEAALVSRNELICSDGRMVAEIPDQARGFRVETPHVALTNLGSSFGLEVENHTTEVHAFKGSIQLLAEGQVAGENLAEGSGVVIERGRASRFMAARPASFASLFDLEARAAAADAQRHDQWRQESKRLEADPSLLAHFDFENVAPSGWQLRNLGKQEEGNSDATLVGCQWTEGRWPEKRALEFQSVSDRVRLTVPGEFQALTLTAWVCVKGLDRKINSLFMSDGFEPGTLHWVIRRDAVLGLTVIGGSPGDYQIFTSPPVVTLDKFGTWMHLAVTVDAGARRVIHYVNGLPVIEGALKIAPPFRIGPAELGNWNAKGFPENDPFMIRNFSGAMDEFCIFGRALSEHEIRAQYSQGRPQPEPVAKR